MTQSSASTSSDVLPAAAPLSGAAVPTVLTPGPSGAARGGLRERRVLREACEALGIAQLPGYDDPEFTEALSQLSQAGRRDLVVELRALSMRDVPDVYAEEVEAAGKRDRWRTLVNNLVYERNRTGDQVVSRTKVLGFVMLGLIATGGVLLFAPARQEITGSLLPKLQGKSLEEYGKENPSDGQGSTTPAVAPAPTSSEEMPPATPRTVLPTETASSAAPLRSSAAPPPPAVLRESQARSNGTAAPSGPGTTAPYNVAPQAGAAAPRVVRVPAPSYVPPASGGVLPLRASGDVVVPRAAPLLPGSLRVLSTPPSSPAQRIVVPSAPPALRAPVRVFSTAPSGAASGLRDPARPGSRVFSAPQAAPERSTPAPSGSKVYASTPAPAQASVYRAPRAAEAAPAAQAAPAAPTSGVMYRAPRGAEAAPAAQAAPAAPTSGVMYRAPRGAEAAPAAQAAPAAPMSGVMYRAPRGAEAAPAAQAAPAAPMSGVMYRAPRGAEAAPAAQAAPAAPMSGVMYRAPRAAEVARQGEGSAASGEEMTVYRRSGAAAAVPSGFAAAQDAPPAGVGMYRSEPAGQGGAGNTVYRAAGAGSSSSGSGLVLPAAPTVEAPVPAAPSSGAGGVAEGPAGGAAVAPYEVGAMLKARLSTRVVVLPGGRTPLVARTEDGTIWVGSATLTPQLRVMVTFERAVRGGLEQAVRAMALDLSNEPGLAGGVAQQTPDLAGNLVRAAAGGVNTYVQGQLSKLNVSVSGSTVVSGVNSQAGVLETVLGSVAKLFSAPEVAPSGLVSVVTVQKDAPFYLVFGVTP